MDEFKHRITGGDNKAVNDFYLFLRDWLLDHIMNKDKNYTSALKKTDIKGLLETSGDDLKKRSMQRAWLESGRT